jgi:uncharacterized protein (TIGR02266 family)
VERELRVKIDYGTIVGVSKNLSMGGMFLSTTQPCDPGVRVRLQIELPEGWTDAEAKVCWSRRQQENYEGGIGVMFTQLSAEMSAYLESSIVSSGIAQA